MPVSICPSDAGDGRDTPTRLIRRVKTVRGEMRCRMVCAPRFDYARSRHQVEQPSDEEIVFTEEGDGKLVLRLRSLDVPLRRRERRRRRGVYPARGREGRRSCSKRCATTRSRPSRSASTSSANPSRRR